MYHVYVMFINKEIITLYTIHLVIIIIIRRIHMLIVQYPMQFNRLLRNISNPCSAPLCADEWWLNLNNYYPLNISKYCLEYHIYFIVEDRDIHNFTLTENWTQVKPLRGSLKQLVSPRNNWAIRPDWSMLRTNNSFVLKSFSSLHSSRSTYTCYTIIHVH